MTTLSLEIVTARRVLLDEINVQRARITTELGELGVEPGHAPLLAKLKPGILEYTSLDGSKHELYIHGGVLEIQPNKITILADEGLRSDEIDAAAIEKAEAEARAKAESASSSVMDRSVALAQLSALAIQKQLLKRRGL